MNTIGKNIRALRQQYGWSQSEVARRLNVSIPAVSKIENGNTDVNMSRVEQIAEIFGVTTQEIMSRADESTRKENAEVVLELQAKIRDREAEIIALQIKLIELYEILRG